MVLHTLRSFCGQIGSHKARDVTAEPAGSGDMQPFFSRWVISAGQLRHGPALHAAGCTDWNRGAFAAVHPRASFTRPSSKCSWCQGSIGSLTKPSTSHQNLPHFTLGSNFISRDPPHYSASLTSCHASPLACLHTSICPRPMSSIIPDYRLGLAGWVPKGSIQITTVSSLRHHTLLCHGDVAELMAPSDDVSTCTCGLWTEQSRHYGLGSQYFGRQAAVDGMVMAAQLWGYDQSNTLVVLSGALHTRLPLHSIESDRTGGAGPGLKDDLRLPRRRPLATILDRHIFLAHPFPSRPLQ